MTSSAKAEDCEYITPPISLKAKARQMSPREAANFDPVAAAEKALQKLSGNFGKWMAEEASTLGTIWLEVGNDRLSPEGRDRLFRAAHDIKGQATTLGFPLASTIADSLCHLLESVQDTSKIPKRLVEQHVQAIRAIHAENARDDNNPLARELSSQLIDVTEEFIANMTGPAGES